MSAYPNEGAVVLVTGAAGDLGASLARRFAEERAAAVVLADIDERAAREVARQLDEMSSAVDVVGVDVRDAAAMRAAVERTVERHGRIDALVNNVGVLCPPARLHEQPAEEWERAVAVNLLGTAHGMAAAIEPMRAQGGGAIVNTASVAGVTAWTHSAPYGATKAAVIHMTKVAALEYAADNIRVNCVCPGAFESRMVEHLPEKAIRVARQRHPLGVGTPADLVGAFSYLAGRDSRWTTGAVLVVDGGYALP